MASSWNILIVLIVLGAAGAAYGILDEPVEDTLKPEAANQSDSAAAKEFHDRQTEFWNLTPLFLTIAALAYGIKQTEYGARRGP